MSNNQTSDEPGGKTNMNPKAIIALLIIAAIVVLVIVVLKFIKDQQNKSKTGSEMREEQAEQAAEAAGTIHTITQSDKSVNDLVASVGSADAAAAKQFIDGAKAALDSVSGAEYSWYLLIWLIKLKPDIKFWNSSNRNAMAWATGPLGQGLLASPGKQDTESRTSAIAQRFKLSSKDKGIALTSYLLPNGDIIVVENESKVIADLVADKGKKQKYCRVYDFETCKYINTFDAVWYINQGQNEINTNMALYSLVRSVGFKTVRWNPGAERRYERGVTYIPGTPVWKLLNDMFSKGLTGLAVLRHDQFFSPQDINSDKMLMGMICGNILRRWKIQEPEKYKEICAAKGCIKTGSGDYVGSDNRLWSFTYEQKIEWDGQTHEASYVYQLKKPVDDPINGVYDLQLLLNGQPVESVKDVPLLTSIDSNWGRFETLYPLQHKQRR